MIEQRNDRGKTAALVVWTLCGFVSLTGQMIGVFTNNYVLIIFGAFGVGLSVGMLVTGTWLKPWKKP